MIRITTLISSRIINAIIAEFYRIKIKFFNEILYFHAKKLLFINLSLKLFGFFIN